MRPIAHQQLQGVFARRKAQFGFGLPLTEMQMVIIIGDWLIQWWQRGIDQQMVVTRSWFVDTRGGKCHIFEAKAHQHRVADGRAILWREEKDLWFRG